MASPGSVRLAVALVAALSLAGCGEVGLMATRYRAEKMLWDARREEQQVRLGGARADSAALERLRGLYGRLRRDIVIPPGADSGAAAERIRVDLIRAVGSAELVGSRLALLARQPGEALTKAEWVWAAAGPGTFLRREADYRIIDALQLLGRYDEAVDRMWSTLDRYPPVPPRTEGEEDPILKMPGLIVALHQQMGDSAAAREDRRRSLLYYGRILASNPTPLLEAQIHAHAIEMQLELGDRAGTLRSLERLEQLAGSTPELRKREAEILLTKGRLQSLPGGNRQEALATFESILKRHPDSPYAARALVESGVIEEFGGKRREALARYRAALERYPKDATSGPIALFRSAMLKDQLGDWAGAKQDLEALPVRFPASRGALEAPLAIVAHYQRSGEIPAARAALLRAVDTYRGLIASDSTSARNVAFRWNIARCYAALDRPKDALATIDEMSARNRLSPLTAVALREGARLAERTGDPVRGLAYLQRYLLYYPNSPAAAQVRADLERLRPKAR